MDQSKKYFLIAAVALSAAGLGLFLAVNAQSGQSPTTSPVGEAAISYPVAELGNCANKDECKKYCDHGENIQVCIAFAESHSLMDKKEAERAKNFAGALTKSGGPGGCDSPSSCEAYCGDINNLEACLSFAKSNGLKNDESDEAQKVLAYIKSGGKMPGGCTTKTSCEKYCGDFSHAEECFNFAKSAGLPQGEEGPGGRPNKIPTEEQLAKIVALAKSGQTPGGCQSKDACDSYCHDSSHREECITFGEKVGFVSPEEAEMFRKTGGKGPGGCDSKETCDEFCNKPENRETCFKFAEEHGLIKEDELKHIKEGVVSLRQGLENAPPEVVSCLKSALGEDIITQIESGNLMPGPDTGEKVRVCFEKFGKKFNPSEAFGNAPPEVLACLKEKLGDAFLAIKTGRQEPTPEDADAFRVCFAQVKFTEGGEAGPEGGPNGGKEDPARFKNFLESAPPEIKTCLAEKLGTQLDNIASGTPTGEGVGEKIKSCFEQFRPPMMGGEGEKGKFQRGPGDFGPQGENNMMGGGKGPQFPPQALDCIKSKVGSEDWQTLMSGSRPSPDVEKAIGQCLGAPRGGGGEDRQFPNDKMMPQGMEGGQNFGPTSGPENYPNGGAPYPENGGSNFVPPQNVASTSGGTIMQPAPILEPQPLITPPPTPSSGPQTRSNWQILTGYLLKAETAIIRLFF